MKREQPDIDVLIGMLPAHEYELRRWARHFGSIGSLWQNCLRGAWCLALLRTVQMGPDKLERAEIACQLALDSAARRAAAIGALDGEKHKATPGVDSADAVRAVVDKEGFIRAFQRCRAAIEGAKTVVLRRESSESGVRAAVDVELN